VLEQARGRLRSSVTWSCSGSRWFFSKYLPSAYSVSGPRVTSEPDRSGLPSAVREADVTIKRKDCLARCVPCLSEGASRECCFQQRE
jgi:hypothetical protein